MNALQPQIEDAPRQMWVAVQDIVPEMGLLYLEPYKEFDAGDVRPVYGVNREEGTCLCPGHTPPDWRRAADDGSYENEILFRYLPSTIEEVPYLDLKSSNGGPLCELIVMNVKLIPRPVPANCVPAEGKVIKHPATYCYQAPVKVVRVRQRRRKKANLNPKQLFLFPNLNQTA